MFQCHVCGGTVATSGTMNEVFEIDGRLVMVEQIPVTVCARCGEEIVSRETAEHIRQLAHSQQQPARSVTLDVFAYA